MFRKTGLLAVAAGLAGTSAPASAAFLATICNDINCTGGDDIIVPDNGAGDNLPAVGGINTFTIAAFGYTLILNTSQSKPVVGSPTAPQLDLNFTATTGEQGGGTIFLYTSDTDFVAGNEFLLTLGGTNSGGSGSITGRAWGGTDDAALSFSPANLLGALGPLTGASYNGSLSGAFAPTANPFSLTIGTTITRTTAGTSTGDLNLQIAAVPEPATWAMMLIGFGAIGFTMRRQKRGAPIAAAA